MTNRVRRIVIVGGGTAGWLSAAYLQRALHEATEITLIESSAVPTVGVGEATIPTLGRTFHFLGMREEEWMPKCSATYKMGIRFVNWSAGQSEYFHPFYSRPEDVVRPYEAPFFPELGEGFSRAHYWDHLRRTGAMKKSFVDACFSSTAARKAQRAPRHPTKRELSQISAYHLDAGLLAAYLRQLATARGVKHVIGHVEQVVLDDRGFVDHITTKDGGRLEADLFIDCTGFQGMIINKALEETFVSDGESLLCDRAVAIGSDTNPERDGIPSCTTATALQHGWCWQVPLYHRNGNGYVYCSRFTSPDQAEAELRNHLGDSCTDYSANHLRMRVGRNRNVWVNNCIAIGLSACFLEPLESTGIFLIEYQLAMLVNFFPDKSFPEPLARRYNQVVADRYEELRDFIVLHYILTDRQDTEFWRTVRSSTKVPDSLAAKLDLIEYQFPVLDRLESRVFRDLSWISVLAGMNALPKQTFPILEHLDIAQGLVLFKQIEARSMLLKKELPDHYQYLKSFHDRPDQ